MTSYIYIHVSFKYSRSKEQKKLKQLIFENLNTTDKISTKNLKQYTLDFSEVY